MKNVLVTGGAGYIGSHVCKALAAAGFTPVTFDNLSRGHRYLVKWGPLEIGDLADAEAVQRVLDDHQPQAVIHLAAFAYIAESIEQPDLYHQNNVVNTERLLAAMQKSDIRHMVFSGSCASYGIAETLPITEDMPQNPINPYGETKVTMELAIRGKGAENGLRSVILRYFNAAGADPDGECGEDHDPEPHVIPRALMAAAGEIPAFDILGTDYPTEDGTAVRDFVHVADVADAHVLALRRLLDGGESAIFNIGSGQGFSVRDIIANVERVTGQKVPVHEAPRRPGDSPILVADWTRIRDAMGYHPRHPDIGDMIESAWRWYRHRRRRRG